MYCSAFILNVPFYFLPISIVHNFLFLIVLFVLRCQNQLIHRRETEQTCSNTDRNLLEFVYSFVIRLMTS